MLSDIDIIMDIYEETLTSAPSISDMPSKFLVTVGLHKESVLSMYFYTLIINRIDKRTSK